MRVYATGFSNGGAVSVALASDYTELFAAISAYGWMVDMRQSKNAYDMPFQVIQGTNEYTYATDSGAMAIMTDEQEAIRLLDTDTSYFAANLATMTEEEHGAIFLNQPHPDYNA